MGIFTTSDSDLVESTAVVSLVSFSRSCCSRDRREKEPRAHHLSFLPFGFAPHPLPPLSCSFATLSPNHRPQSQGSKKIETIINGQQNPVTITVRNKAPNDVQLVSVGGSFHDPTRSWKLLRNVSLPFAHMNIAGMFFGILYLNWSRWETRQS